MPSKDQCLTCKFWMRGDPPPERMPGVRDNYRKCTLPKISKATEYRGPTDWCNKYEARGDSQDGKAPAP